MPDALLRNLPYLAEGLGVTLGIAAVTAVCGTALGLALALLRHGRVPVAGRLAAAYIGLVQGTPVLVVLLLCFIALPGLLGYRMSATAAATLGFSLFLAAYAAEDIRSGLRAVPAPLTEAAAALGLTSGQTLRRITIPLAARVALPALIGQYVRMVKYTSTASIIGVAELTGRGLLVNARIFQPLPILAIMAVAYLVVCLSLSLAGRWLGRRWA